MTSKKVITLSLVIAFIAELFLIFIIYLNPYKIKALIEPAYHMWLNALFNFLSFSSLTLAFIAIKNKKIRLHKKCIHLALVFSALFLVSYILYHLSVGHVRFENNEIRPYYLFILITHLLSSFISLPLVFMSYGLGFFNLISTHKKIAFITYMLWSYVSLTGILVVIMIKSFHQMT